MKTNSVKVENSSWDEVTQEYSSVRIPDQRIVTILVNNKSDFAKTFEDSMLQQAVLQGVRDIVMTEYNDSKSFPKFVMAPYKAGGDAEFELVCLEQDESGLFLFAYYDFVSTIS